jgi:Fe-S cluster assembly protein SufD
MNTLEHIHVTNEVYDTIIYLDKPGERRNIFITIVAGKNERKTITLAVHHTAADTHASIEVRTLSTETASILITGLLHIAPSCPGSSSFFTSHSLQFDASKATVTPSLRIETDDVQCSHAATLRTITDADLVYPRSRGMDAATARSLIIESFLAPPHVSN